MGYASDMQDTVTWLANIIKNSDDAQTIGELKDEIAYDEQYLGLRSILHELGTPIEPVTKLEVSLDQELGAFIYCKGIEIIHLLPDTEFEREWEEVDEGVVLTYVYKHRWQEVQHHVQTL